ncbi:MAG TPA: hypothetical protein VHC97_10530 [Thermoanaerobaculia bacterium]|nr:hypothetical protein [Thermoanaerobaculia bacterium]
MRKLIILGLFLCTGIAMTPAVASAQEGDLRFEKTVSWQTGKLIEINALVGPVRIGKLEFSNQGKGGGSISSRFRPGGGASDTQTTLRASFDGQNPKEDEWVVEFTLEFLDSKGKLIDRATGKESWEGEAKTARIDHAILEYVVPMIDKVRIRLEARLD